MPTMIVLVDGTIPVAADFMANFNALNQAIGTGTAITGYTLGDTLYASASDTLARLAAGTPGMGLVQGATVPAWAWPTSLLAFHWNAGDSGAPAGTTNYMGGGLVNGNSEGNLLMPLPFACRVSQLFVAASTAPTAGQTFTYTVRKNAADTALTCQIANTATSASDVSNTVTYAAGDTITLKVVTSASAGVAAHNAAVRLAPA